MVAHSAPLLDTPIIIRFCGRSVLTSKSPSTLSPILGRFSKGE